MLKKNESYADFSTTEKNFQKRRFYEKDNNQEKFKKNENNFEKYGNFKKTENLEKKKKFVVDLTIIFTVITTQRRRR